jgi:TusA-related sulfurtransferase
MALWGIIDLTGGHKGFTDLIAEKEGEVLRIEIEHRSTKKQIETNIRKNLEYSDVVYEIASDEVAKKKVIQVALRENACSSLTILRIGDKGEY